MGQTIDTTHIAYVARLLRHTAPSMPEQKDSRLFLRAAQALESRVSTLTYGAPAANVPSGKVDLLV